MSLQIPSYLFLGDCNTLGTPDIEGRAYPELLAKHTGARITNCGHTMCTVREGTEYFQRYFDRSQQLICIQFGLVDSWLTFKYAPYALYYPDSPGRKLARKLIKKYKKWCKQLGLNRLLGSKNVVPLEEYRARIHQIIQEANDIPVILIETIPNKDTSRNPEIRRYNQALKEIAQSHAQCFVLTLYDDFAHAQQIHYSDSTHLSEAGHAYVARKLQQLIEQKL